MSMEKGDRRQVIKEEYKKLPHIFKGILLLSDDATKLSYVPTGQQRLGQDTTYNILYGINLRVRSYGIDQAYTLFIDYYLNE